MTPWLTALILARAMDATTTIIGLQSPYINEAMPWMPTHPVAVVAVQGGMAAGQAYVLSRLSVKHPKLAKGLTLVQVGASGTAVGINIVVIRRVRGWK
jgi:hypothetical protein